MSRPDRLDKEACNLLHAGVEKCKTREYEAALDYLQAAFIRYRKVEDRRSASLVQQTIAQVIGGLKDPSDVRGAYSRASALLRQSGMKDEEARTLRLLGRYEISQSNRQEAFRAFRAARSLCQEIEDVAGEALTLCDYAQAQARFGKAAEARSLLEEAETLAAQGALDAVAAKIAEARATL